MQHLAGTMSPGSRVLSPITTVILRFLLSPGENSHLGFIVHKLYNQ